MNILCGPNNAKTKLFVLFIFLTLGTLSGCGQQGQTDLMLDTFQHLRAIKDSRQNDVIDYLMGLSQIAKESGNNSILSELWNAYYADSSQYLNNGSGLVQLDKEYTQRYGDFYDILWVDTNTFVFYSLRQEQDFLTVIDQHPNESMLYGKLKQIKEPTFLDFDYYIPSSEPAAFFVIPVLNSGQPRGWQVFQLSINKINGILSDRHNLGRSGEVYLLNDQGMMLSQSRFLKNSTILEKKIDTETYRTVRFTESGELSIIDYRGEPVFSVFDKVALLGIEWIFIAEIDEAEIFSARFLEEDHNVRSKILSEARRIPKQLSLNKGVAVTPGRVDMNEYRFIGDGQSLITHGVSTCTAVSVTFPGRFAYLSHLVPTDITYSEESQPLFGNTDNSNLLARMMETMLHYDVYPFEKDSLKFIIIATHNDSFWHITEQLIALGFNISQITLVYNPEAICANVLVDSQADGTIIDWVYESRVISVNASQYPKLDDIYRRLVLRTCTPLRSNL